MAELTETRQSPETMRQPSVLEGSRVVLLISKGPSPDPSPVYSGVPEVMFTSQGEALERLEQAGLSARVFDTPHDKVPRGHVIAQTPPAEQTTLTNAEVVVLVSSGRPAEKRQYVVLPNVIGRPEAEAIETIRAAGLSPQTVHDWSASAPVGVVVDQVPNPASVRAHVRVTPWWLWAVIAVVALGLIGGALFLWLGRTVAVPDVTGMTQQNAQARITAAGFRVGSVSTTQTAAAASVGRVVSQKPEAGTLARVRSAVDIVVSGGQSLVKVPDLDSMTQAQAASALDAVGLKPSFVNGNSPNVVKGHVMAQAPTPGQMVPAGTSVGVTISQGPAGVPVPSLVEMSEGDAVAALKSAGLVATIVRSANSAPSGQVYAQAPDPGTLVQAGSEVSIHVSTGPAPEIESVQVPDVIGKTQSDATTQLQNAGFEVEVTQLANAAPDGQVVGQAPPADSMEPKGSTITILVSTGSTP